MLINLHNAVFALLPRFLRRLASRFLFICSLSYSLSFSVVLLAENKSDLGDDRPDITTLLKEYHAESDDIGSMQPSVLAYQGSNTAETLVDFERGLITINGTDTAGVKQAAVEILLTQIDPGVIDARTASDFGLINSKTKKPFFYAQIIDQDGLPIASVWRANRFVDYLMNRQGVTRPTHLVIPMTGQHKAIAGEKYLEFAKLAGAKHRIPIPLIMAIIETESAFNPLARSRSNALGLMQIKADTAGRDYFSIIDSDDHTPSSAYLYNPKNNVEVGTGYLSILADHYLAGIYHPQKLQYAIISSYNGGSGNLFRSLTKSGGRKPAIDRINAMSVKEFYWFLTHRHIRVETRNYVKKVTARMKKYTSA